MTALDFPDAPSVGDTFLSWRWDGTAWRHEAEVRTYTFSWNGGGDDVAVSPGVVVFTPEVNLQIMSAGLETIIVQDDDDSAYMSFLQDGALLLNSDAQGVYADPSQSADFGTGYIGRGFTQPIAVVSGLPVTAFFNDGGSPLGDGFPITQGKWKLWVVVRPAP